jgi:hypothetical protein
MEHSFIFPLSWIENLNRKHIKRPVHVKRDSVTLYLFHYIQTTQRLGSNALVIWTNNCALQNEILQNCLRPLIHYKRA